MAKSKIGQSIREKLGLIETEEPAVVIEPTPELAVVELTPKEEKKSQPEGLLLGVEINDNGQFQMVTYDTKDGKTIRTEHGNPSRTRGIMIEAYKMFSFQFMSRLNNEMPLRLPKGDNK